MSKPTLQIDLLPVSLPAESGGFTSYYMHTYVGGLCIKSIVTAEEKDRLVNYGLVKQVTYQVHVEGKVEDREYQNKVDENGVQYTSKIWEIEEQVTL